MSQWKVEGRWKVRSIEKSSYFRSEQHIANHLRYLDRQSPLFDENGQELDAGEAVRAATSTGSVVWRHIFSLNDDDARRLGVDRSYMQDLLAAQKARIAQAYNIDPQNLRIAASWHDKDYHPHLHIVMWSTNPREGYIPHSKERDAHDALNQASSKLKSILTNEIFQGDLKELKVRKSQDRDVLNQRLLRIMQPDYPIPPEITEKLEHLGAVLAGTPGKHTYKFLPPDSKQLVDDLLQTIIEQDPTAKSLMAHYAKDHLELMQSYVSDEETLEKKMADWLHSFYHPFGGENPARYAETTRHNIIIRAAEEMARKRVPRPKTPEPVQTNAALPDNALVRYQAAAQGGDAQAAYRLGAFYAAHGQNEKAVAAFQQAAEHADYRQWAKYQADRAERRSRYTAKQKHYTLQRLLYALCKTLQPVPGRSSSMDASRILGHRPLRTIKKFRKEELIEPSRSD